MKENQYFHKVCLTSWGLSSQPNQNREMMRRTIVRLFKPEEHGGHFRRRDSGPKVNAYSELHRCVCVCACGRIVLRVKNVKR